MSSFRNVAAISGMDATKKFSDPLVSYPYRRVTTAQRNAIVLTASNRGFIVYNTTTNKLNFWNGSAWEAATSS